MGERIATLQINPLQKWVDHIEPKVRPGLLVIALFGAMSIITSSEYFMAAFIFGSLVEASALIACSVMNRVINKQLKAGLERHGLTNIRFDGESHFFAHRNGELVKGELVRVNQDFVSAWLKSEL